MSIDFLILFAILNMLGASILLRNMENISIEAISKLRTMLGSGMFLTYLLMLLAVLTLLANVIALVG
jgi:hypothetical protein